ncbi:MAG TPA: universal stress protein [Jatrophihabitans sp.]|nr:universal stress protein [Jatrophihabitans sp.]
MTTRPAVVAGVDCTPRSVAVLRWADAQARLMDAQLVAVTAWGTGEIGDRFGVGVRGSAERSLEASLAQALPPDRAGPVVRRVVPLTPVEALTRLNGDVALVVVGGRHPRLRPLASVAGGVVSAAGCPVAIVSGPPEPPSGRIVVGVDGTARGWPALSWALAQARRTGAKVDAVLAWRWAPAYAVHPYGSVTEEQRDAEQQLIAQLSELDEDERSLVRPLAIEGHPAGVLLEVAAGADLVVVGSRGAGPVAGRVLGSTSQELVHRCPVPLVVVPHVTHGAPVAGRCIIGSGEAEEMTNSTGTIELSLDRTELTLLRNALETYIADFGHDEAEIRLAAQRLLSRIPAAAPAEPV